jgi:hypothetical protein
MSKATKIALAVNVTLLVLIFIAVAHAQRPPEFDATGAPYLRVNINPTNVPPAVNINPNGAAPAVNINPNGAAPRVEVTRLPDVRVAPGGCQSRQNYLTGIGRSVAGPLMVSYLQLPPNTTVTLNDGGAAHSMNMNQAGQITTAIFLRAGQSLDFNSDVMYSGCRPD